MREKGSALFLMRNSWSSRVKMSFVTVASVRGCQAGSRPFKINVTALNVPILYSWRRRWQRARVRAVFPEPTGLWKSDQLQITEKREPVALPADTDGEAALLKVSR